MKTAVLFFKSLFQNTKVWHFTLEKGVITLLSEKTGTMPFLVSRNTQYPFLPGLGILSAIKKK